MATGLKHWNKRVGRMLTAGLLALLSCLPATAQDMLTLDVRARDTLIGISARYLEQPAGRPETLANNSSSFIVGCVVASG